MNHILEALREGMKNKLIIGKGQTEVVPAGSEQVWFVPLETNKLLVKSIEVVANKQATFYVEFFENSKLEDSRYNSGEVSGRCYDNLDLPFVNGEDTKQMYVVIHNTSTFDTSYRIEVRGTEMK